VRSYWHPTARIQISEIIYWPAEMLDLLPAEGQSFTNISDIDPPPNLKNRVRGHHYATNEDWINNNKMTY